MADEKLQNQTPLTKEELKWEGSVPSKLFDLYVPDVKALRLKAGMSHEEFAKALGVLTPLIESWESNVRCPSGAALKLLVVIEKHPEVLQLCIDS